MSEEVFFGHWLKQRRAALDLTQWDLAERVGCSRDAIQKIEAGTRRPSKQIAELLVACLEIVPEQRAAFARWARLGPEAHPAFSSLRCFNPPCAPRTHSAVQLASPAHLSHRTR